MNDLSTPGATSLYAKRQPVFPKAVDGKFRRLLFDGVEPARIGRALLQEFVARAHGAFEGRHTAAVLGIDGENEAVEKAAAVAGRSGEQAVHTGRQPDDPQMVGESAGAGRVGAVDADAARALARRDAGAEIGRAERAVEFGGTWHPINRAPEELRAGRAELARQSAARGRAVPPAVTLRNDVRILAAGEAPPTSTHAGRVLAGEPAALVDQLAELHECGVEHLVCEFLAADGAELDAQLRVFAERVRAKLTSREAHEPLERRCPEMPS